MGFFKKLVLIEIEYITINILRENQFGSVQSLSCVQLFATPWTAAHQASLSFTISWTLLKLMSIERQWCHLTVLSCVVPFCLQSSPASGSFPLSWLFVSGGQRIRDSASASVLPMSIQDWFPLEWASWISLLSKGPSRVFSNTTVQKHQRSAFFRDQLSHPYMTTRKTIALTGWTFVGKVSSLLFNMLSRFVIAFLSSSKHLLISWLQSPSAVILEPQK